MADNPAKQFKANEIIDLTSDDISKIVEPSHGADFVVGWAWNFFVVDNSSVIDKATTVKTLVQIAHDCFDLMKHSPKDQLTVENYSDIGKKALQIATTMINATFQQPQQPQQQQQSSKPKYSVEVIK